MKRALPRASQFGVSELRSHCASRPHHESPYGASSERKGEAMQEVCLVAPLLSSKMEATRTFMGELDGARRDEYDASERRIGIRKEVCFLAPTPAGELLVGYIESGDFENAFAAFVRSRDEFDVWFKERRGSSLW
jgi:hypothetical protein